MKKSPFFSIIIPAYNRASILPNAIFKLIEQSFTDWECIVVDDGSTDNTGEVIAKFVKSESRITYVHQNNSERSISRNNGAKLANGAFIIFLDSDDYFEKNHLQILFDAIKDNNQADALYFTNAKLNDDGKITTMKSLKDQTIDISFFVTNSIIPARVCLPAKIMDKYSFDNDCIVVEDSVLWTEITEEYPAVYIDKSSVVYLWHDDNSVNILKNNAFLQRFNGLKKLFYVKSVGKKIPNSIKRNELNNCYFGIAKHHAFNKRNLKAIQTIIKSIFIYPDIRLKEKIILAKDVILGKYKTHSN